MIDTTLQQIEDIKLKKILLNILIRNTKDKKNKVKFKNKILNNKIDIKELDYSQIEKILNEYGNEKVPKNSLNNIFNNIDYNIYKDKKIIKNKIDNVQNKIIKLKGVNLKKSFKNFFHLNGGSENDKLNNINPNIKEHDDSDIWKKL
jgi:hypothetical protein